MLTEQEFYEWEHSSRDTIDVKRCYIDIAGDLVSGLLLSQIIYWFIPGEKGSKLRVKKQDRLWLAKGRTAWWDECRISAKQFDRAIKILQEKNFVEVKRFRFSGSPTIHIWLNINALVESVNSSLTKGEVPKAPLGEASSPSGELDIDEEASSLTETTSKINSKTTTDVDLLSFIFKLPYFESSEEDVVWLQEFMVDYPAFNLQDARACRDFHSSKRAKVNKGIWKNRFRNWMIKKAEFTGDNGHKDELISGQSIEKAKRIARGELDVNRANKRLMQEELTRRGISYE